VLVQVVQSENKESRNNLLLKSMMIFYVGLSTVSALILVSSNSDDERSTVPTYGIGRRRIDLFQELHIGELRITSFLALRAFFSQMSLEKARLTPDLFSGQTETREHYSGDLRLCWIRETYLFFGNTLGSLPG
jgi:hypothetical protein